MKKIETPKTTYILAVFGDLNLSLLLVASILYGITLGASPVQSGLIGGAYGLSYFIMAAILGKLGDKMPRKRSLIFATISQISVSLYYMFIVSTIFQLIIGQMALGCAYGFFWPSIEAYISENTSESKTAHQRGISSFCIAWSIGFMIGPLLGGVLSDYQVQMAFYLAFFIYTSAFFSVVLFLPKLKKKENGKSDTKEGNIIPEKEKIEEKNYKKDNANEKKRNMLHIRILFGVFIYALLGKLSNTYFVDYAARPEGLDFTGTIVGVILFSYGIGRTLYFVFSRYVESSLKKITYSYAFISILLLILALIKSFFVILAVFVMLGILSGLIYKSSLEILLMHQENEEKGAKAGLFESAIGLGSALTPILAGLLGEISPILPFLIFSGISFAFFLINIYFEQYLIKRGNR